LFLFGLIAVALAQYEVYSVYNNGNCDGTPLVWTALIAQSACVESSCTGVTVPGYTDFSSQIQCSTSVPSAPDGVVAFSTYQQPSCVGDPSEIIGITTGCVCEPGIICYQATCNGADLDYATYSGSDTGCTGTATAATTYNYGCISAGGVSFQQSSCSNGGASIDWNGYLKTWLSSEGQTWDIPTFATTTFYSGNGQWTYDGNTVSVQITFTSAQDSTVIDGFIAKVCTDMIQNANAGVCAQATTECASNPDPVHAACTWVTVSSQKRDSASVVTMNSNMNSGVVLTGLLALVVSFLVMLL